MTAWLTYADDLLCRAVTRASHWIQGAVGWTSFRQAMVLTTAFGLGRGLEVLDWWFPSLLSYEFSLARTVLACIAIPCASFFAAVCLAADRSYTGNILPAQAIVLREFAEPRWGRVCVAYLSLWMFPLSVITLFRGNPLMDFALRLSGDSFVLLLYVVLVTPLPRSESGAGRFLREFRSGLSNSTAEASS